jgi:hypothetical protein
MAVILAFDVVALLIARASPKGNRDASARGAKAALGRFASTEVAYSALYHRTDVCHATLISRRAKARGGISKATRASGGRSWKRQRKA